MQVKAGIVIRGFNSTLCNCDNCTGIFIMQLAHLSADHQLSDDYRLGCCDRCGHHTAVLPEIGPQAENVCRHCLQLVFEADYSEYRRLLAEEHRHAVDQSR